MNALTRQKPVFRFAPSPNGPLHLGHALSALLNADMAKATDGRLLLRMEDIDTTRCTPEFEAAALADLEWLGLDFETPVRRQSEHFPLYRQALDRLTALGLTYPAFLTRGEVRAFVRAEEEAGNPWPRDPDGAPLYPPLDKELGKAERDIRLKMTDRHAIRLDMAKALALIGKPLTFVETGSGKADTLVADPTIWGDVVLWRSDAPSSYHLSVSVDDAAQSVTHIVRGQDLFQATAVHRLLQVLLDLPEPVYHHHRLLTDAEGRKLSKSNGDTGLAELRAEGLTPADIRSLVGL